MRKVAEQKLRSKPTGTQSSPRLPDSAPAGVSVLTCLDNGLAGLCKPNKMLFQVYHSNRQQTRTTRNSHLLFRVNFASWYLKIIQCHHNYLTKETNWRDRKGTVEVSGNAESKKV